MSWDEKTTEIEIPGFQTPKSNIVHVNFGTQMRPTLPKQAQHLYPPVTRGPKRSWWNIEDLKAPWALRLLAVLVVLGLSLLIF